jgi:cobalamin synthase
MNPAAQSILALAIVGCAAVWLVRRSLAKKKTGGCGGDCGCPSSEVKAAAAKISRKW